MDNTPLQSLPSSSQGGPLRRNQSGTRLSRFVFTLPNWTQEELDKIIALPCTWMIVGKEISPETGTPHLQGACILGTQMTFSKLKTLIGSRAHIESMRGRPADSLVYCSKEDSAPFVKGTLPTPGKRNDLHDVVQRIMAGDTLREIASDPDQGAVAIVKFNKGLTILRSLVQRKRVGPPRVFWLYGSTGTGKTRCAFQAGSLISGIGDDGIWISSGGLQWFDGYDGQPVVILDDFRSKGVPFDFILRLLDRYPMSVPFKGGFVNWAPRYIFITCPYDPDECFATRLEHRPEDIQQLKRRITKVFELATNMGDGGRQLFVDNVVELSRDDETDSA